MGVVHFLPGEGWSSWAAASFGLPDVKPALVFAAAAVLTMYRLHGSDKEIR
jgi:hypothetical protein